MIPKIIHYCWFGGNKMPQLAEKCLASWKKYCPDYEIKCWNEESFDINSNKYVKEAYENKKYAFVTDYVRLYALYNYGGIYMDTDVEVIKNIDEFLKNKAFSSFESSNFVPTGLMGSEKELPIIFELLNYYQEKSFYKDNGELDLTPNTATITRTFEEKGLIKNNQYQIIDNFSIYPSEYFCPIDYKTKQKNITTNTYAIHWFSGSWLPKKEKIKKYIILMFSKIFGEKSLKKLLDIMRGGKRE